MAEPAVDALRNEVLHLFKTMQDFRTELAALGHPKVKGERFERMTDQLDAIVKGTEDATETILHSAENIADTLDKQRPGLAAEGDTAWLDAIDGQVQEIFQACAFQDLTGQRITKVVESLKYIDEKLHRLVRIWGQNGLDASLPLEAPKDSLPAGERLDGPALKGEGVSQDDIDKMFD
jgi:chemotaxis protein CheZ